MARIQTEVIVIELSKLVKDTAEDVSLTSDEFDASLEAVIQELAGDGILVEIERRKVNE